jgi:sugar lactone lactonase YvrE
MPARVAAIHPLWAIEGSRITLEGTDFPIDQPRLPDVRIGDGAARVVFASASRIVVAVPAEVGTGGPLPVRIEGVPGETQYLTVGAPFATGLHQVDNPVFDRDGNLFVTYSGTRGQQVPVSIFRVRPNGTRETFSSGIVNPTSMAFDPAGRLYVSSRFEGTVYRVEADGTAQPFASDLGVACGLAFDDEGFLFVGDRSGTIFKVAPDGHTETFASLPPSVAAFHLAFGPDRALYVSGPTLSSFDSIYRIVPDGSVSVREDGFGRPQGIAFDPSGTLYVVEALAGASGVYRLGSGEPELALAAPGLVGLAFDRGGTLVVCSNETAYRLAIRDAPGRG